MFEILWKFFHNDKNILDFLKITKWIKEYSVKNYIVDPRSGNTKKDGYDKQGVLNLKGNTHPRGLIMLESIFTKDDGLWRGKLKEDPFPRKVQEMNKVNIDTLENPKFPYLSDDCIET